MNEVHLGNMFAFCLPGVTMATCKIITGDSKQGHIVLVVCILLHNFHDLCICPFFFFFFSIYLTVNEKYKIMLSFVETIFGNCSLCQHFLDLRLYECVWVFPTFWVCFVDVLTYALNLYVCTFGWVNITSPRICFCIWISLCESMDLCFKVCSCDICRSYICCVNGFTWQILGAILCIDVGISRTCAGASCFSLNNAGRSGWI